MEKIWRKRDKFLAGKSDSMDHFGLQNSILKPFDPKKNPWSIIKII